VSAAAWELGLGLEMAADLAAASEHSSEWVSAGKWAEVSACRSAMASAVAWATALALP
jgi:hypothetical protein